MCVLAFASGQGVLIGWMEKHHQNRSKVVRIHSCWVFVHYFFFLMKMEALCPTTGVVIIYCHIKSTFSHMSQPDGVSLLFLHRIREDDTSEWWFFLFSASSWGTHLPSFFAFPICFTCWLTIEWLMLSSSATSRVVVKASALVITLSWSLSTSDGWPLLPSSSGLLSPL